MPPPSLPLSINRSNSIVLQTREAGLGWAGLDWAGLGRCLHPTTLVPIYPSIHSFIRQSPSSLAFFSGRRLDRTREGEGESMSRVCEEASLALFRCDPRSCPLRFCFRYARACACLCNSPHVDCFTWSRSTAFSAPNTTAAPRAT